MSLARAFHEPLTVVAPLLHIGFAILALADSATLFNGDAVAGYSFAVLSLTLLFGGTVLQFYRRPDGPLIALTLGLHVPSYILTYAGVYRGFGLLSGGEAVYPETATAVYFSIVTITTLGYGDFSPRPDLQFLAAVQAITGLLVFGVFVGLVVHQLGKSSDLASRQR
eukprot:g203.t1